MCKIKSDCVFNFMLLKLIHGDVHMIVLCVNGPGPGGSYKRLLAANLPAAHSLGRSLEWHVSVVLAARLVFTHIRPRARLHLFDSLNRSSQFPSSEMICIDHRATKIWHIRLIVHCRRRRRRRRRRAYKAVRIPRAARAHKGVWTSEHGLAEACP